PPPGRAGRARAASARCRATASRGHATGPAGAGGRRGTEKSGDPSDPAGRGRWSSGLPEGPQVRVSGGPYVWGRYAVDLSVSRRPGTAGSWFSAAADAELVADLVADMAEPPRPGRRSSR